MRILIVGAGALGGYFGGRLLQAQCDVTFLLRPRRAEQLKATGLVIKSPFGDAVLPPPPYVHTEQIDGPYDVVMLACKAYDLDQVMEAAAPAVGPDTVILPLLNGLRHIATLGARFGSHKILGAHCIISAALDPGGTVLHLNDLHNLTFGELDGSLTPRVEAIASVFGRASFNTRVSQEIMLEMWEKWIFIAAAAGLTCLMRATAGDLVEAGAGYLVDGFLAETSQIAKSNGFAPRAAAIERGRAILTAPGSLFTASMLKDIERGADIEADHIVGDLLARATNDAPPPLLLKVAYSHLKAYEARRRRENSAGN
jgi:2-dehydropantoate 2-reductase